MAMKTDFDFRLGGQHLRGAGRRGLLALAMVLGSRVLLAGAVLFAAQPGIAWLIDLLRRLRALVW